MSNRSDLVHLRATRGRDTPVTAKQAVLRGGIIGGVVPASNPNAAPSGASATLGSVAPLDIGPSIATDR